MSLSYRFICDLNRYAFLQILKARRDKSIRNLTRDGVLGNYAAKANRRFDPWMKTWSYNTLLDISPNFVEVLTNELSSNFVNSIKEDSLKTNQNIDFLI